MWKIAQSLLDIAHALVRVAIALAEHDQRGKIMAEAIDDLEAAQTDRASADSNLSAALGSALDRVKTDVQHLEDEIGAGAGNTDPTRLMRVTQGIRAGIDQVKAMTDQLNAEDPDPSFPANDGGVPATSAPETTPAPAPEPASDGQSSQLLTPATTDESGAMAPAV